MPVKPVLLSGGNPQIAKGYGEAPVWAYLAAVPGGKQAAGRRSATTMCMRAKSWASHSPIGSGRRASCRE